MFNITPCAISATRVIITIFGSHILASLLHGALDTESLHILICGYLRIDMMPLENRKSSHENVRAFSVSLRAGNFARAQATGANRHGGGGPVNDCLYLTDIGLPSSVCFTMRVGNCLSKNNALSANATLCHIDTSYNAQTRISLSFDL